MGNSTTAATTELDAQLNEARRLHGQIDDNPAKTAGERGHRVISEDTVHGYRTAYPTGSGASVDPTTETAEPGV